jgi:hypothetical protein
MVSKPHTFSPADVAELKFLIERLEQGIAFRTAMAREGKYSVVYADSDWNLIQAGLMDPNTGGLIYPDVPPQESIPTTPESSHTPGLHPAIDRTERKRGRPRKPTVYDGLPPAERQKLKMRDYMRAYREKHPKKPKE